MVKMEDIESYLPIEMSPVFKKKKTAEYLTPTFE